MFSSFLNDTHLFRNAYYGMSFRVSSTLKRPKGLMEETVNDTCLVVVFKIHFNYPKRKGASVTKVIRLRKS